eukprot:11891458-Alexandrium_andersonii.AAC.1
MGRMWKTTFPNSGLSDIKCDTMIGRKFGSPCRVPPRGTTRMLGASRVLVSGTECGTPELTAQPAS